MFVYVWPLSSGRTFAPIILKRSIYASCPKRKFKFVNKKNWTKIRGWVREGAKFKIVNISVIIRIFEKCYRVNLDYFNVFFNL